MLSTCAWFSTAQVIAWASPAAEPAEPAVPAWPGSVSVTRTGRIRAPGAIPRSPTPARGAAAMMLATAVPCPTQSCPPVPVWRRKSRPGSTLPLSCGYPASTPESMTATVTPVPSAMPASASGTKRCCAQGIAALGWAAAGVPPGQPAAAFAAPAGPITIAQQAATCHVTARIALPPRIADLRPPCSGDHRRHAPTTPGRVRRWADFSCFGALPGGSQYRPLSSPGRSGPPATQLGRGLVG